MKKKAIIFDLEGTITNQDHRSHYCAVKNWKKYRECFYEDSLNKKIADIIISEAHAGLYELIILTAKPIEDYKEIYDWLFDHSLIGHISYIYCRPHDDHRPSVMVKEEILVTEIMPRYEVVMAYDDRDDMCKMYIENGIKKVYLVAGGDCVGFLPAQETNHEPFNEEYKSDNTITVKAVKDIKADEAVMLPNASYFLQQALEIFSDKNQEYGNSYQNFGKIMKGFFPEGLELHTEKDFTRFAILNIEIAKTDRYCKNFGRGGHADSLKDKTVYSAMLNEVDHMGGK